MTTPSTQFAAQASEFANRLARRSLLVGAGLGGACALWGDWLLAAAKAETAPDAALRRNAKAKSVILIFNCGAPSHLDLWDMKPQAANDIRGEFQPISTNVPGIQISELLPSLARHADKLAIVRTVHHKHSSHNAGMYWSIVGRPYPIDSTLINPSRSDHPSFGTLVGWLARRDGYGQALPPYVITPLPHCDSFQYLTPGQFGACLGPRFDPFVVGGDLNQPGFRVKNLSLAEGITRERLFTRSALLDQVEAAGRDLVETIRAGEIAAHRQSALALTTSDVSGAGGKGAVGDVFDLSREPDSVRERYGRHSWGQSHLLARRLVEAGVPFVTTVNGPSITWDTHEDNFNRMKNQLVPPMERAFAALLEDLAERGLLESTLVVWMGDFGRTPKINGKAGRDHWPQCYSVVLAGGGVQGGQTIGESDAIGAAPRLRPVTPADIHATVFSLLGYDSKSLNYRMTDGRPMAVSEGEPLAEVV